LQHRVTGGSLDRIYNKAIELFKQVLADDPSSAEGQIGLDFVRHSIRLLGLTDKEDSITAKKKQEIDNALDETFAEGVGRFRFGMTPSEVSQRLHVPMSTSGLPADIAQGDIFEERNYFWRPLAEEYDIFPIELREKCLISSGMVVFMFHDSALERIGYHAFPTREPCEARSSLIDRFASKFGLIATGSSQERRFRYETQRVGVKAISTSYSVKIDFIQR
jgi:hypothetical protein